MIDYKEDSLPFYQGGTIVPKGKSIPRSRPAYEWPRWIVMTRRFGMSRRRSARKLEVVGAVNGWWYANRFRIVEILVVRKKSSL